MVKQGKLRKVHSARLTIMDLEQLKINFQIAIEHSDGNKISLKNGTLGTIFRIASGYPFLKILIHNYN